MGQLVDAALVWYYGKNELLKSMIALQNGTAVAIFEGDKTFLWFNDKSEFEIKRHEVRIIPGHIPSDRSILVTSFFQGEIKQLPVKDVGLPPSKLVRWAAGKSLSTLKRTAKKNSFTLKEVVAIYHWHRAMAKEEHWTRDTMERCWRSACENTSGVGR